MLQHKINKRLTCIFTYFKKDDDFFDHYAIFEKNYYLEVLWLLFDS